MEKKKGCLYVVATPIGNLDDFSSRSQDILGRVDIIVAEDPRHSSKLISRSFSEVEWVRIADALEKSVAKRLLIDLNEGKNAALISDAGTPLISDPGYRLVRACRESGVAVVPVPGPCAAIAALSVSGIACSSFRFVGFLSTQAGARTVQLKKSLRSESTTVLYESPHRIQKLSQELLEYFPENREVFFVREMTKKFEESFFGTVKEFEKFISEKKSIKGEMVIVISPSALPESYDVLEKMAEPLAHKLGIKEASVLLSKGLGLKKNMVYEYIKEKQINL